MKRIVFVVFLVAALAGGAYAVQRSSGAAAPIDPALVHEVQRKDLLIEVVDTAQVRARERVEIKSKVAGQVASVHVVEGARVRKGQLLLRLDPAEYRREVARAEADVAQAQNTLAFAELTLARKEAGLRERGVAQADVDEAGHEVRARRVTLASARVSLESARERLHSTELASPIDGTVLELGIQVGEVVTPGVQQTFEGRPLLVVGDLSVLVVRAELNQIDVAKVALGQAVSLGFDALPEQHATARVTKVAPAAVRPAGKTIDVFPVEATLEHADPSIKPGMSADVRFRIDVRPGVLVLPIEAVLRKNGKAFVTKLVRGPEGAEVREEVEVELGVKNDREYELVRGLGAADRVLVDPASAKANEVEL